MAFRGDSTDTYTYSSGSTGSTVDLGARNNYRYVNATNVYNKGKSDGNTTHTQTYTYPTNDTGGTKDLGVNHYYRYINASNVYNKGTVDATFGGTYDVKDFYTRSFNTIKRPVYVGIKWNINNTNTSTWIINYNGYFSTTHYYYSLSTHVNRPTPLNNWSVDNYFRLNVTDSGFEIQFSTSYNAIVEYFCAI